MELLSSSTLNCKPLTQPSVLSTSLHFTHQILFNPIRDKFPQTNLLFRQLILPQASIGRSPNAVSASAASFSAVALSGKKDKLPADLEVTEVEQPGSRAKEDGDKPGLEAMLRKVLQLYACSYLSKRSYAKKGNKVLKAEEFLEAIIKRLKWAAAPEAEWSRLLINGLIVGKGEISPEEFYGVIKKRLERILIRTEGGSYQQRVLIEYVKGIQSEQKSL